MRISRDQKKAMAAGLAAELSAGDSIFASFAGMTFADASALRESLRPAGARFRVVRRSVAAHALKAAGLVPGDRTVGKGPTALLTVSGPEAIAPAARAAVRFAKARPVIEIKGGFQGGQWISPETVSALSEIGSRPELLSQLAASLESARSSIRFALDALIRARQQQA